MGRRGEFRRALAPAQIGRRWAAQQGDTPASPATKKHVATTIQLSRFHPRAASVSFTTTITAKPQTPGWATAASVQTLRSAISPSLRGLRYRPPPPTPSPLFFLCIDLYLSHARVRSLLARLLARSRALSCSLEATLIHAEFVVSVREKSSVRQRLLVSTESP